MANITTTPTVADNLASPGNAPIAVRLNDKVLFSIVRTATATLTLYKSTDSGGSWTSVAAFTHTGLQEWSSLSVDPFGWAHIAYRVGTATLDTIWYRRVDTKATSPAWSAGLQTSLDDANGGVIGSAWGGGVDMAVVRNKTNTYAIVIAAYRTYTTTKYGVVAMAVSITKDGDVYLNNAIISNNRIWTVNGSSPGRSGVQVEVMHNGLGYEGSTPHVWISWGRTSLRMVRLAWTGVYSGWSGPSGSGIVIRSTLNTATDFTTARWDGKQYVIAAVSNGDPSAVRLYQRNAANTASTVLADTPSHPQGTIRYIGLNYDGRNQDPRVYAVGTSTNVLYYCDYSRAAGTWSAWATVIATALANTGQEFGTNRGGTYPNARYNVVTAINTVSPYTVAHTAQTTNTPPDVPTWDFTTAPYRNGGVADVGAALGLAWTFSDSDPGQSQSSYALARTIGAGATQYWNATTSSWGASEVQNSTSSTSVSFPSGWALDSDANYVFRVKVWDTANTPSSGYSGPLQLTPSAKVNPTMTAPTGGGTVNQDTVTVTWTVAQQTAWMVQLLETATSRLLWNTGTVVGTDTSYTVPVSLTSGTQYTAYVWTANNEGLLSNSANATFTAVYAPPVAAVATPTAVPASGYITVTSSGPATAGTQPATVGLELYRRVKAYPVLNASVASFPGNVTGWTGASGTLSYSTSQFVSSPGAARVVPDGVSADARFRLSTPVDVTADIAAGRSFEVGGWVRPDTANKSIIIRLDFYDASSSLVGNITTTQTSVVAGAWHYVRGSGNAAAFPTAAKVSVSIGLTGTPAAGDAFYADDVTVRVYGGDDGVRVSTGTPAGGSVNDWSAAALTDYEYRWKSTGANGGVQYGPWAG